MAAAWAEVTIPDSLNKNLSATLASGVHACVPRPFFSAKINVIEE
jgi:hypothetical protein